MSLNAGDITATLTLETKDFTGGLNKANESMAVAEKSTNKLTDNVNDLQTVMDSDNAKFITAMGGVIKQVERAEPAVKDLTTQFSGLDKSLDIDTDKLTGELGSANKSMDTADKATGELKKQISGLQTELNNNSSAKYVTGMNGVASETNKAIPPVKDLTKQLDNLDRATDIDADGFSKDMNTVDSSMKKTEESSKNVTKSIEDNKEKLESLGKAMMIVGGIITAVVAASVIHFKNLGDSLNDMSEKTGMSVESLSALKYAAEMSGAQIESLSSALPKLAKNIEKAATGSDGAREKFEKLGITVVDSSGKMRDINEILLDVSERFAKMEDGAEKTALAVAIFGNSGADLIPMLNNGREGIEQLTARAKELGIVMTDSTALSAAKLDDALVELNKSIEGVGNMIGAALAPLLTDVAKLITGLVVDFQNWAKENPILADAILVTVAAVGAFITIGGTLLMMLPKMTDGLKLLGLSWTGVGTAAGKATMYTAAFIGGWQLGSMIDDTLGLSNAIQSVVDWIIPALDYYTEFSMKGMQWTEHGKHALFLRDSLVQVAQQYDKNITGLRAAAQLIRENEAAYRDLDPRLRRIVDGMTDYADRAENAKKNMKDIPAKTEEMVTNVQSILDKANSRINEATKNTTDFKIAELDRELIKNKEILAKNRGTKEEYALLEKAHLLSIQKIRDEAYKVKLEKEKKQDEEKKKKTEEEYKKTEERWKTHQGFLNNIHAEQQKMIYDDMIRRKQWREAELYLIQQWENDQKTILYNALNDKQISFKQYQEELTSVKKLAEDKRWNAKLEAFNKEEKAELEMNERLQQDFEKKTQKRLEVIRGFFDFMGTLNDAYTKRAESNLNQWYDQELLRINNSKMSNEEKEAAISDLNNKMHRKKAELDEAAAKREKALAIAQAIANTAVAITKAAASAIWPLNLPAIAFAIALGAAQIAAIGGAYKSPDIGGYAPGGGGGGEGGGGSGGGGGTIVEGGGPGPGSGTIVAGGRTPRFANGTNGYITPPSQFIAGDPLSPEIIQVQGNRDAVKMSVTPLGARDVSQQVNVQFNINAIDAASFMSKIHSDIMPVIREAILRGYITIPRRSVI
jgi:methyl-accepting chemotaxis protein